MKRSPRPPGRRTLAPKSDLSAPPSPSPASPPARPLTPRPKLLLGLMVVFVVWGAALVVMYFTTVYPHRQAPPAVQGSGAAPR